MKQYFKRSLSRQFILTMAAFITLFIIGSSIIVTIYNVKQSEYQETSEKLENKERIVIQIDKGYADVISDIRGYFAFNNPDLLQKATSRELELDTLIKSFEGLSETIDDQQFINEVKEFDRFYFEESLPPSLEDFEKGQVEELATRAKTSSTPRVEKFQDDVDDYRSLLDSRIEEHFKSFTEFSAFMNFAMVTFNGVMLLLLLFIIRASLNGIGRPLTDLAHASERLSVGDHEVTLPAYNERRQDELAVLTKSFSLMLSAIKEKEQTLIDSNDELLHQQDELQAQQMELENLIDQMEMREDQLRHLNQLINSLSNSLDEDEVLNSIVKGFSAVIGADRGMIVLLDQEHTHASWGLSEESTEQFIEHIFDGLSERVIEEKQIYVTERKLVRSEKGLHTEDQRCYDIYIPVISSTDKVEGIMVFSRFSSGYSADELEEYFGLSKQIAISLEKIQLYTFTESERVMNQRILDTIHEGVQLMSLEGELQQINKTFCELFNCEADEMQLGSSLSQWMEFMKQRVEQPTEIEAFIHGIINGHQDDNVQLKYTIQDPKYRVIEVYAEPLIRDFIKVGWVFVHRDITKEHEADQMKNELVSTVSHELRTPLASVLGFTELLLNKQLKEDRQKKYLTTIYQEAKRLTSLINDFLDVQRMESGKQTYDKKFHALHPLLEDIINNESIQLSKAHQMKLIQETDNDMVFIDRDKMIQTFQNLIHNAIKYSPEGGIITVSISEDNEHINVSIKDQGLGIPKEALPNLFTKFFRVDNTDRRKIGGTGLGLAIAKEIVKAHDGDIRVESELKEGSTFTVSLPKMEVSPEILVEQNVQEQVEGRVIIVEDDRHLASLLSTELIESGFQIETYSKGEDAIEALKREVPDAIVLDIMLDNSRLNGWDVLEEVKQSKQLSEVPIFISSALDEKEKAYDLGAQGYLVKPYSPSQLSKLILQALLTHERRGAIHIPKEDL